MDGSLGWPFFKLRKADRVKTEELELSLSRWTMLANIDELLPTAKDCMKKLALVEAEKASEEERKRGMIESEKKALLDRLMKPSVIPDEERLRRAAALIKRAVDNGLTQIEVGRFPNQLCTDHGRAINQREPGWENTLTGLPLELFRFWEKYLKPRGYKVNFQVVNFPGGMPGEIGVTLSWGAA